MVSISFEIKNNESISRLDQVEEKINELGWIYKKIVSDTAILHLNMDL